MRRLLHRPSKNFQSAENAVPLILSHRGDKGVYPEPSVAAYANAASVGLANCLEGDVRALSDGNLAMMHDATVDAATDGTGDLNTFTTAQFKALNCDTVPLWGSSPPALFDEYLAIAKAAGVTICPEIKETAIATSMCQRIVAAGMRDRAIVQSFTLSDLAIPQAFGIRTMLCDTDGLLAGTAYTLAQIAPATWIACERANTLDATITALVANGIKVCLYTYTRKSTITADQALGVTGFFCDDSRYLDPRVSAIFMRDRFALLRPTPGMVPSLSTNAGVFKGTNRHGWNAQNPAINRSVMLDGAVLSSSFTMDFTITFDALSADVTRFGGLAILTTDPAFLDVSLAGANGYDLLLRQNGQMVISQVDDGVPTSIGSSAVANAITGAGTSVAMRIVVDANDISITRLDVPTTLTVTDSTYRGRYIYHVMGSSADVLMAVSFSDFAVS